MGVGVSLILIAAGAVDIHTIGVILMVVGIIGLLLSLVFWSSWGGFGGGARRRTYVEDAPPY